VQVLHGGLKCKLRVAVGMYTLYIAFSKPEAHPGPVFRDARATPSSPEFTLCERMHTEKGPEGGQIQSINKM